MIARLLLLLLTLLAGGCAKTHPLEARWLPLREVVERPDLPTLSPTATTTLGDRIYVVDLDGWLTRYPPGTVDYEALLLHEQEHARRELGMGVGAFIARYLNDSAFQWQEEQRGWFLQLRHWQARGRPINRQAVALALSQYRNLTGRPMVSFAGALAWVDEVLSGAWSPPEEEPLG